MSLSLAVAFLLSLALGASASLLLRRRADAALTAAAQRARAATAAAADTVRREARSEADRLLREARVQAAETERRRKQLGHEELDTRQGTQRRAAEQIELWEQTLSRSEAQVQARSQTLSEREKALGLIEARKQAADQAREAAQVKARETLQHVAQESFKEARSRLIAEWVEESRAEAADRLRHLEQGHTDPETQRQAKRVLDIASQRYYGHYLTERLLSNLPITPELAEQIGGTDGANFVVIGEVANVKLTLSDDRTSIRLEGQDSFGREIARRALHRFGRNLSAVRGGEAALRKAVQTISEELERETVDLGRKAFKELEIPRAHPDIVRLVGRLNYRTSYSQNQWKHAVEAAFLCGMMAAELRLDVKIARRAALMHDIGKSLTHAIDGSHAVIGADYARRLGESELVANAIGAHHLDEPFNSPYAYIVAASDAMSGARPGARHEQEGSYVQRIDDLERLVLGFQGIDRVYALQAGRELRVHVKETAVDDVRAAELTGELAAHISENLVFPGQIKVTVIREVTSVAVAN